jgi:hypothetical protein
MFVETIHAQMAKEERESGSDHSSQVNHSVRHKTALQLPKFQLPKFDGSFLKWQPFWDSFKASIHDDTELPPIQKLTYLLHYLEGPAFAAVKGYSITANSYEAVVKTLQDRFGKKSRIIHLQYCKMIDIEKPTNQANIRVFYDEMEQYFISQEALGENMTHQVFVSIILKKLPSWVLIRLEELNEGKDWNVPTLRDQFKKFINSRENCETSSNASISKSDDKPYKSKYYKEKVGYFSKSTTNALMSSDKQKPRETKCAFCGKDHYSDQCKTYSTVGARRAQIKGRCFLCLRSGHMPQDCRNKRSCFYCKSKNHHQSLCPEKMGSLWSR